MRWYDVEVEEFHPKMMMLRQANQSTIISGSTNFTSRNLDNYNLEASLMISGPNDADVMREVDDYFLMLWHNEGVITPWRQMNTKTSCPNGSGCFTASRPTSNSRLTEAC